MYLNILIVFVRCIEKLFFVQPFVIRVAARGSDQSELKRLTVCIEKGKRAREGEGVKKGLIYILYT